MIPRSILRFTMSLLVLASFGVCHAELKLSAVFSDHMVLQQKKPILVWGWTDPGEGVAITLSGGGNEHSVAATADRSGRFEVKLPAMEASFKPHTLKIQADETRVLQDVLIGEVWLCSGQSNMAWNVNSANDADLEALTANYPNIRLISVPQVGTQETQNTFNGSWQKCAPDTVRDFSAVGYFFGRQLHQTLNVPIGLIDNAWGGSACEAWVSRDLLAADEKYGPLLEKWRMTEATYDHEKAVAAYQQRLAKWNETKKGNRPRAPRNVLAGQHRPANLYHGVLKPVMGYTIQGCVWYQGESNSRRAYQYRDLFPLMISSWRDEWGQGDFSFYWVQLADFMAETEQPEDSAWAELREAQTMTMSKLPATGEAVIIDLGEASDIHPKNKQDVAKRLARWALAKDYGMKNLVYRSPMYQSMSVEDGKAILKFAHVGGGLDTFDVREPIGFAIATADGDFVNAQAKIVGKDTIQVWHPDVSEPAAVRYAWANNPICNVQNKEGLPLTPFRTDNRPGVTATVLK